MGPIHPRIKREVGERLAKAAAALHWGSKPSTGPVFSGCRLDNTARKLTLAFNSSLLKGDSVVVRPYNSAGNNSAMEVQVNVSAFAHSGRPIWSIQWLVVNISAAPAATAGDAPLSLIRADLSPLAVDPDPESGSPFGFMQPLAVRFAWSDTCVTPSSPEPTMRDSQSLAMTILAGTWYEREGVMCRTALDAARAVPTR